MQTDVLDLLYADYIAKNASAERKMLDTLQACDNYYLKIGTKKAAVVYQPVAGNLYNEPTFTANGQREQVLEKFTYLAVPIADEVAARIVKASVAFGRLRGNV